MKARVAGVMLGALLLGGCSEEKEDAIEAASEVRQLCKENKKDQAAKKGAEMYEGNPVFQACVDDSAANWNQRDSYNYCGPAFQEASRKMAEWSETEGCGCHVVGMPARGTLAWVAALGLGALVLRRSKRRTS